MSETLTITKKRVIEAANKCNDAKKILKTIFPEVFRKHYVSKHYVPKPGEFYVYTDWPSRIQLRTSKECGKLLMPNLDPTKGFTIIDCESGMNGWEQIECENMIPVKAEFHPNSARES